MNTYTDDDQNPSSVIAGMAEQRKNPVFTPTAGEAKLMGQYDQRQAELDRIANAGGGAAILPDTAEAENAEKTARWAAEDAAAKVMRGPGNRYQGAATGPSFAGQRMQAGLDHRARQRDELTPGYEHGGKPETTEQLLARMKAQYGGVSSATDTQAQAAPAPVTPQAPAPKPPGGLIQQAAGMMANRTKAIDKAAGYAHGGKITGPGTATSDSIPAQTGTGRPIRVANGERIVSVEQDKALQRIAEMLNYESVDAMFEALTGKPVGPTIKGGKLAAANGLQPGQTVDDGAGGVYTPEAGFNPGQAAVNLFKDSATAARTGVDYDQVRQTREQPAPIGNEGRSVPHPVSVPASRPGAAILAAAQPVDNMRPADLTTKDIAPGGYLDRGNGIVAQRGASGRLNVTNVGTEALTDPTRRAVDDSASALIDQKNSTYNPARQLENMQRSRTQADTIDPTITDPGAQHQAGRGALILNASRQGAIQEQQAGTQNQLVQQQVEQAKTLAGLQRELLDPATPPERRKAVQQTFAALHGRDDKPNNLEIVQVDELLDPKNPMMGTKKVPHTFDPRTGQFRPMLQANDPVAQARAAIARGADPKAVNARLKAMGHPEIK